MTDRDVRARTIPRNLRLDSSVFVGHNLLYESSSLGNGMTTEIRAHEGPARGTSAGRLGALAGLTPVAMVGAWIAIVGWGGTTVELVLAAVQIALGAVVGGRLGRSIPARLLGPVAYGLVGSFVLLPLEVVGSTWEDLRAGRVSDLLGVVISAGGYLLYGAVSGIYAAVYLLPFGAGWMVTFLLLQRAFGR
jgi:hypothetical protein